METDKITSSYRKSLGETQTVVDVTLQKEDEGSIGKILSSGGNAYLDEIEILNGEAHYMGGVTFSLLYQDGEGKTHVLSDKAELSGKIENVGLNPLMKPIFNVEVVDTKVTDVDSERAKIASTIAIKLDVIQTDEIEKVKATSPNLELKNETAKTFTMVTNGTKTFEQSESYDTKVKVQSVLLSFAHVGLKNVSAGTGYFTVEGDIFLNSVLQVDGEDGTTFKNFMETLPFKEEIEDELIQKDDDVLAFCYVKPQDLSVVLETPTSDDAEKNQSQTLQVKATVTTKYLVMRETDVEVQTDAFSMTNKLNLLTGTFPSQKTMNVENFKATVEGQTTIGDDQPRISKIVAVTNERINVATSKVENNELTIEGIGYLTVVYQTEDDALTYNSVDLEIPFSNKFETSAVGNLFVSADSLDIEAKAKKGKEITASIDAIFNVTTYQTENQVLIKDIELTEDLIPNDYSLELYIAPKGSTLWDISKHLLVTEEVLLKQNPDLVFPLETSQSIVYFRQKA